MREDQSRRERWEEHNAPVIKEFRANAGLVADRPENHRLLLLRTTGVKSGRQRVNPVVYRRDGERLVVIATNGGASFNPDWYHNLVGQTQTSVEVGVETFPVRAMVTTGSERQRIWNEWITEYPLFAEYAEKAGREIPVILLERIPS